MSPFVWSFFSFLFSRMARGWLRCLSERLRQFALFEPRRVYWPTSRFQMQMSNRIYRLVDEKWEFKRKMVLYIAKYRWVHQRLCQFPICMQWFWSWDIIYQYCITKSTFGLIQDQQHYNFFNLDKGKLIIFIYLNRYNWSVGYTQTSLYNSPETPENRRCHVISTKKKNEPLNYIVHSYRSSLRAWHRWVHSGFSLCPWTLCEYAGTVSVLLWTRLWRFVIYMYNTYNVNHEDGNLDSLKHV